MLDTGLLQNKSRLLMLLMVAAVLVMGLLQAQPVRATAEASTGPNQVVQLAATDVGFGAGKLVASFVLAGKTVISKNFIKVSDVTYT